MLVIAVVLKLVRAISPTLAAGRLPRLQILLDGGDLSAAVRHRRLVDSLDKWWRPSPPYVLTIVSTVVSHGDRYVVAAG